MTNSRHFDPLVALGSMNTATKANIRRRTAKIVETRHLKPPHYPRKLLQRRLRLFDIQSHVSEQSALNSGKREGEAKNLLQRGLRLIDTPILDGTVEDSTKRQARESSQESATNADCGES